MNTQLPLPPHYNPSNADKLYRVEYQKLADAAREWADRHHISAAHYDNNRIALLGVDIQNTFCLPDFELFVAGPLGNGAVEDTKRLTSFLYKNLAYITSIFVTMDTHQAMQIFHSLFFIDNEGNPPSPMTVITQEDIEDEKWKVRLEVAESLGYKYDYLEKHLRHYVKSIAQGGKYDLTIWPYHAMLGGVSHALVPLLDEAIFFHTIARFSQPDILIKGSHPLTEHYSIFKPEVSEDFEGKKLSEESELVEKLKDFDAVIITGQAKSHCVAWTIDDMLTEMKQKYPDLVNRTYLLEDCTSPVVVPGVVDYTKEANKAFIRFKDAGMQVVNTEQPLNEWPGIRL